MIVSMGQLRWEIDRLDQEIQRLFQQRLRVTQNIMEIKKAKGIEIVDLKREEEILKQVEKRAQEDFKKPCAEMFEAILRISKGFQYEQLLPKVILLIGFMGSGKTTVGRLLSQMICASHQDIDEMLKRQERMSIAQIFERRGEEGFRDLEQAQIRQLGEELRQKDMHSCIRVISCGGGAVLRKENIRELKQMGVIVLLSANAETIVQRLRGSKDRPLLKDGVDVESIAQWMKDRESMYKKVPPDLIIDTSLLTPNEVAAEIIRNLYGRMKSK